MAKSFRTPVNLPSLASPPAGPVAGQTYYDSTLGQFGIYDGVTSAWTYLPTLASVDVNYTLRVFAV